MYVQPPPWLIVAVLLALALPASSIVGLAAGWLFWRLTRPRQRLL